MNKILVKLFSGLLIAFLVIGAFSFSSIDATRARTAKAGDKFYWVEGEFYQYSSSSVYLRVRVEVSSPNWIIMDVEAFDGSTPVSVTGYSGTANYDPVTNELFLHNFEVSLSGGSSVTWDGQITVIAP